MQNIQKTIGAELLDPPENTTLPPPPEFSRVRVAQCLVFYVVFCRSLFVPLTFSLWPWYCM